MAGKDDSAKLDVGVLTAEQQEKLRQFKIQTRIDNEKYLSSHPEVKVLIDDFMRDVLLKRPADIQEFAAALSFKRSPGRVAIAKITSPDQTFMWLLALR